MGLDFELVDGQTPLDEEEKEGLLIPTITTRAELDEFEQQNIERAIHAKTLQFEPMLCYPSQTCLSDKIN